MSFKKYLLESTIQGFKQPDGWTMDVEKYIRGDGWILTPPKQSVGEKQYILVFKDDNDGFVFGRTHDKVNYEGQWVKSVGALQKGVDQLAKEIGSNIKAADLNTLDIDGVILFRRYKGSDRFEIVADDIGLKKSRDFAADIAKTLGKTANIEIRGEYAGSDIRIYKGKSFDLLMEIGVWKNGNLRFFNFDSTKNMSQCEKLMTAFIKEFVKK